MRKKKILKNIIVSLLQNIVVILCGFIVPKIIITKYGSATNGLINSITQFLGYITLLEAGVGPVIKSKLYKPIAENNNKDVTNILYSSEKFFKTIVKIFIIYVIILCVTYPYVVIKDFDYIFTLIMIVIISVSTIFEYYFGLTYTLFLQSCQKAYVPALFRIISTIINTIVVVVLALMDCNILVIKIVCSLAIICRPILLNIYTRKKYNINIKEADKDYELPNKMDGLAQHIAAVIHGNTDITILTFFTNMIEVSVYSVYIMVINGVKSVVNALTGGIDASFGDMIAKKEDETLRRAFLKYEKIYFTIITVIFSCTLILIVPFIKVYTLEITDANYVREWFAFLMVLAEYVHSIRLPYSTLTLAAGHFKETKKGAWLEAIVNITISVAFVFKFGLVGVAIGTLVSMLIRTIEFNYHTSKYILHRSVFNSSIIPTVAFIQPIIFYFIFKNIYLFEVTNYFEWVVYAAIVFIFTSICTLFMNYILYKNIK